MENEIIALLRLQKIPGLGPVRARKLLALAGGPTAIFDDAGFPGRARLRPELSAALSDEAHLAAALSEYEYALREGVNCLTYLDKTYPTCLAQCEDAPLLLFDRGLVPLNDRRIVAVVGTRAMTGYGRRFCENFLAAIAPANPVIVSGLAYGVDACAQQAALDLGLHTVACLAHGLDVVYPQAHAGLATQIGRQGGLLSEFWSGTNPEPHHFLRRNRIIAGLCQATVVVESATRGGSLVTADLAFGYSREVFAVPGRSGDTFSEGCNNLISQQKAQLLTSGAQFLEAMDWTEPAAPAERRPIRIPGHWTDAECKLASHLREHSEPTLDELARDCGLTVQKAAAALFDLELQGFVRPLPGKRYAWEG